MSKSKNDLQFQGGTARVTVRKTMGKLEVKLMLIDLQHNRPYTYSSLMNDLINRKEMYPALARIVDKQSDALRSKADKTPNSKFCRIRTLHVPTPTNTEQDHVSKESVCDESIESAKKELLAQVKDLACLLYRPQWEINVKSGNITIQQYVDYMDDAIFANVPPA